MPKERSGLASGRREMETQEKNNDGNTRVEELEEYFNKADDNGANEMLDRWRNDPLDADNRQQDNDLQKFFNSIGWTDRTPEVLDETDYQKALADAGNPTQWYHSDNDYGGVGAAEFAKQFFGEGRDANGNLYRHFLSGGVYGDGTYFADTAFDSSSYGHNQFRGFLNNRAKIVSESMIQREFQQYMRRHPAFRRMVDKMTSGYSYGSGGNYDGLVSMFAAMRGYNVITNDMGYISVLDRSVITVSRRQRYVGGRGIIRNW